MKMKNIYIDTSKSLTVGRCKIANSVALVSHYHKQTEFVYVIKGTLSVSINNETRLLEEGGFAVIRSLDIHSFEQTDDESLIFLLILPDIFSINLSYVNIVSRIFNEPNENIKRIIDMYDAFGSLDEKYMSIYYRMFYQAIKDLYVENTVTNEYPGNKIANYINEHFKENLTLNTVAAACSTNRSYVSRAINEFYSISFTQYINRLRISAFLEVYLKNDNRMTIEDIALDVGFLNVRSFYRAFSAELNCTPTEYIKMEKK